MSGPIVGETRWVLRTPFTGGFVFDAIVLQCTALLTLLTSGGVPKLRGVSVISGIQASKSCGRGANP